MTTKKSTAEKSYDGFSEDERAAMKERAKELKTTQRGAKAKEDGEAAVREKLAEMGPADRAIGERIHELVLHAAPDLTPKTWYGMPAYARDGKLICFFQSAEKFKSRYATLGFEQHADLDEGTMWPTAFAITELTKANEARITELVQRATS
ncbi:uncharacterized protein DUF1801 [Kribbella amoyensis]|uniref:Uncharacterized protein DUF1801 n=1 Tax=Kribbella amoyensis TaxID=996641 RepID=A0A561B7M9_9ACTN|nr:DUF1801 domain-containing protein [Kribbella amoyensis]TWD74840.1 uncharacterized protein DUF1801 [Kribbella amoyensis]